MKLSKKVVEETERDLLINAMLEGEEYQDEPLVGSFWYDTHKKELFGVVQALSMDIPFYLSTAWKTYVRTGRALHKNIWQKEFHRKKDKRFQGDYTKVPRGRVFEFKDEGFRVYTGSWINNCPEAKQEIIDMFQLPPNKTTFLQDIHWEIGHGWSDEF